MKTAAAAPERSAAIVHLTTGPNPPAAPRVGAAPAGAAGSAPAGAAASALDVAAPEQDPVPRARAFAEPLLVGQVLDTGEDALGHADGTAAVLRSIGAAPALCAAAYLVYASDYLQRPEEVVKKAFGASQASLVALTRKLVQIQRAARLTPAADGQERERSAPQTERVRKMLLAFTRDLRVVLLRLASRLQTLRWLAASKRPCPAGLAQESQQVFAPLANRLGIWQIKWEMEDLAFRFLRPDAYQQMARLVDEKRAEREASVHGARQQLAVVLAAAGQPADVQGRPKHLYSIWKKMQGKGLAYSRVFDTRALRVVVPDVAACYAALARVHEAWAPVAGEFDDYIARPKANGYQSLHTVVLGSDGRPLEVQIRTPAMHQHAEHGVAAHWMYKEAGLKGAGAGADSEDRIAEARKAVLRELLAWERDFTSGSAPDPATPAAGAAPGRTDGGAAEIDRIYVFTPQATLIDLPAGGTPVDFAYSLHTDLGHRCRGARVDGVMVPLNTRLQSGQTVEVVALKEGGPSLDWLNPELHYLASPRSKAKVRAWFNAQQQQETIARGREAVEKLLQRQGRTAVERDGLAEKLGFKNAEALFEVVGKDEFSLRQIEAVLRPPEPPAPDDQVLLHRPRAPAGGGRGGVLVVGMDSLLTSLARCCRPAPPDVITGFVTRGRGVAVHRQACSNLRQMAHSAPGRVIEVAWGDGGGGGGGGSGGAGVYPLDVVVEADDRAGLLRDISEVFAKDRINVTSVQTQSAKDRSTAWMTFTVEVSDTARLGPALAQISRVAGVRHARRR